MTTPISSTLKNDSKASGLFSQTLAGGRVSDGEWGKPGKIDPFSAQTSTLDRIERKLDEALDISKKSQDKKGAPKTKSRG